jgi:phenylacetaldehyde dehydrogenase
LIVQAAAGNLKKVTLELGGKSPVVVLDDADVEQVIPGAANAIFFNHGQCCCAGSRLMIHKKVFDKVVAGVAGLNPETQTGPLVSEEQFRGAEVVTGGSKGRSNGGYFVEPTVLTNTRPGMKVVREEIFGPVVCAQPITDDDLDEIARQANSTTHGLAASVWTRDISKANKLAKRIRAGTVWINCHNVFDASLPFGGYKESGWGREMGEFVLNNYIEVKAVTTAL